MKRHTSMIIAVLIITARFTVYRESLLSSTRQGEQELTFQYLHLSDEMISTQSKSKQVSLKQGEYRVSLPRDTVFVPGDYLKMTAKVSSIYRGGISNSSSLLDLLIDTLWSQKRATIGAKSNITNIYYPGKVYVSSIVRALGVLQSNTRRSFTEVMNHDLGYLVSSMFLGGSMTVLPSDWQDVFRQSGLAHILSASGYNVVLVSSYLERVCSKKRKSHQTFIFLGIWAFVGMASWSASVVRAAVMRSIQMVGRMMGREVSALKSLTISIWLILLFRPDLLHSLSLWLSACATAGILLFQKKIISNVAVHPQPLLQPLFEDISVSIAATLGVLPIQLFVFQQFNPVSPIANGLVGWAIAPIMLFGLLSVVTRSVPMISQWFVMIVQALVNWMIGVATFAAPFSLNLAQE